MRVAFGIAFIGLLLACSNNQEKPLAEAFGEKLYYSEYESAANPVYGLSPADSLQQLNAFVNNWIKEQVLAHKAEMNLSDEEKEVQALLDAYRNSLIIFRYQQKLINERLDTHITEQELRSYFEANKDNFILNKNIVKLRFAKLERDNKALPKIRTLIRQEDGRSRIQLADLCKQHAVNSYLDDETWLEWDDVKKEIPLPSYNDEHFLKNNKYIEIPEGEMVYVVYIHDYRTQQSTSAFEMERDKIRKIILQQRSINLIKKAENDLLNEAISEGRVKVNLQE